MPWSQPLRREVPLWLVLVAILVTASIVTGVFLAPNVLGPRPDFQMQPIPLVHTFLVGCQANGYPPPLCYDNGGGFKIFVKSVNGFTGIVTLSAVTPTNVIATTLHGSNTANPIVILGPNDTAFLGLSARVAGNYTVTINGISGRIAHSISMSIIVQDMTFNPSPDPLFVPQNSKANLTIAMRGVNGLFGNLTLLGGPWPEFTLFSPFANCIICSGSLPEYPLLPGGTVEAIMIVTWEASDSGRTVDNSLVVEVPGLNGPGTGGVLVHNFTIVFG